MTQSSCVGAQQGGIADNGTANNISVSKVMAQHPGVF